MLRNVTVFFVFLFVGIATVYSRWDSDTVQVEEQFNDLIRAAQLLQAPAPLELATRAPTLLEHVADTVSYRIQSEGELFTGRVSREELKGRVLTAARELSTLEILAAGTTVTVPSKSAHGSKTALLTSELHAIGGMKGSTEKFYERQRIVLTFKKDGSSWVISDVESENLRGRDGRP